MSELLLGCGHRRVKTLIPAGSSAEWKALTTLDLNPNCGADIVFDLDAAFDWPLPRDGYDEVHAYEVLEHIGRQGDVAAFFHHFGQIYRALKPGGHLCATVPSLLGRWVWGDPGHTRLISRESLVFLDRALYQQLGHTPMSDYRPLWPGDFELVHARDHAGIFEFVLRAIKPAREYEGAR